MEYFVFHRYFVDGFLRSVAIDCSYCRDYVAFVVDFVRCHDVGLITFKIYGVFARGNFSFICGWEVTVGENGEYAVHSFRC